ncbi:hypothetical protein LOTGIDRAFT_192663 [Lottia gigantea]|uniref:PNK FHA domain-containing protein n=1 Tax=Lottia gigantea TaxID=225164 RepID=V4A8X4_LOTGI|nr:hypothetical protein LOTGIDRAFT_192663 [Lottia gigantea]ESO89756.1 hypothetical protein LOTGIDRAFT_192663 [Lottia gigantea]
MKSCELICKNGTHDPIPLPDGEVVVLGRSPLTKIKDAKCSRNQVQLIADWKKQEVDVKQLGNHSGHIDQTKIEKGSSMKLKPGSTLYILNEDYPHEVQFQFHDIKPKRLSGIKILDKDKPESPVKPKIEFKFFTKKTPTANEWKQHDKLYVYSSKDIEGRSKIAGFDIDGTIITTASGKVFPTHSGDWKLHYPEIPKKIKELYASGYKIVLFTNQMGVARGKVKIEDLKEKFTNIVERLKVPIQVLVATGAGMYRKPCTGMWDFLKTEGNDGVEIKLRESFYVGDAAGRPDKWNPGRKKDFSCSDRLFAINIGVLFHTPEEFFLNKPIAKFSLPSFDPRNLSEEDPLTTPPGGKITSKSQEVIVLTGFPASGKTFFAKKYLVPKGYVHVNRDTLGTWQKCVSLCKKSLQGGKSVVVDNTNPNKESRERYVSCARDADVPVRCFVLSTTIDQAKHNERFREATDKSHKAINDLIMNSFKSKLVFPDKDEGFSEILKVNFVPKFENPDHFRLYRQFLMDK